MLIMADQALERFNLMNHAGLNITSQFTQSNCFDCAPLPIIFGCFFSHVKIITERERERLCANTVFIACTHKQINENKNVCGKDC